MAYDKNTDVIIYSKLTDGFDAVDFANLCVAAADQAGASLKEQDAIRQMMFFQMAKEDDHD